MAKRKQLYYVLEKKYPGKKPYYLYLGHMTEDQYLIRRALLRGDAMIDTHKFEREDKCDKFLKQKRDFQHKVLG